MSVTSLAFFACFGISLIIFWLLPKKARPYALLAYSLAFFLINSKWYTLFYLIITILITTISVRGMEKTEDGSARKKYFWLGLITNLVILILLKYINVFKLAAPLGISFYTFQIIGYLVDVYGGVTVGEKSFVKTALFAGYFPQMISGPISRHKELSGQLDCEAKIDFLAIRHGLVRMLWGAFKKLVISERIALVVNAIYADPETYSGAYVWLAALLFMMQLYADFGGCMDIVIGASECFGIILPENFRSPFVARSVQEFWQRWHITLGSWLKDYILYSLMHTSLWKKMTKSLKNKFGKKAAKQIPSYVGMFFVWLVFGLWHGGDWKFILGEGMLCFLFIMLGDILAPIRSKICAKLHINEKGLFWHIVSSIWTYLLICFANMFFAISSFGKTIRVIRCGFGGIGIGGIFDGSILNLGVTYFDLGIIIIGIIVLIVTDILAEIKPLRARLEGKSAFTWWIAVFILVIGCALLGEYGIGYNASSFIYQTF